MLSTAKIELENKLKSLMHEGFKEGFKVAMIDPSAPQPEESSPRAKAEADQRNEADAQRFADKAVDVIFPDFTDAIYDFVKQIEFNIMIVPASLAAPNGPVTGALTISKQTSQIFEIL